MEEETRAALREAINCVAMASDAYSGEERRNINARLQALLYEKGGGGDLLARSPDQATVERIASPPDSPAKIAAEMVNYPVEHIKDGRIIGALVAWAARVEALGLEPGERVAVVDAWCELRALRYRHEDQRTDEVVNEWLDDIITALTPLAEKR